MKHPFNCHFDITWRVLFSLGLLIMAVSCSSNFPVTTPPSLPTEVPPTATIQPSPLPLDTPIPPTLPATLTPAFAPSQVATALPGAPVASPSIAPNPPTGGQLTITLAEDGKTITVSPGMRFLLALDGIYDWDVSVDHPNVVSQVPNSATDGNQGLYQVQQSGSATLSATGNPKCLKSVPRCLMPSRLFRVQITSASAVPTPGALIITLVDNGKTIAMASGQTFLLSLGADFDWTVNVTDPSVLSRVPNITVIRGAQGVYQAHRSGKTALTATGTIICPPGKVCGESTNDFKIQIVVK